MLCQMAGTGSRRRKLILTDSVVSLKTPHCGARIGRFQGCRHRNSPKIGEYSPLRRSNHRKHQNQASYSAEKKRNQFTKVQMNFKADAALSRYFSHNLKRIESWFNVISPVAGNLEQLEEDVGKLNSKDWEAIL